VLDDFLDRDADPAAMPATIFATFFHAWPNALMSSRCLSIHPRTNWTAAETAPLIASNAVMTAPLTALNAGGPVPDHRRERNDLRAVVLTHPRRPIASLNQDDVGGDRLDDRPHPLEPGPQQAERDRPAPFSTGHSASATALTFPNPSLTGQRTGPPAPFPDSIWPTNVATLFVTSARTGSSFDADLLLKVLDRDAEPLLRARRGLPVRVGLPRELLLQAARAPPSRSRRP
jgi:hypothetical protein